MHTLIHKQDILVPKWFTAQNIFLFSFKVLHWKQTTNNYNNNNKNQQQQQQQQWTNKINP